MLVLKQSLCRGSTSIPDPDPDPGNAVDCQLEALRVLDVAHIISGAPILKGFLAEWITILSSDCQDTGRLPDPTRTVLPGGAAAPTPDTDTSFDAPHIRFSAAEFSTPPSLHWFSGHLSNPLPTPFVVRGAASFWPALSSRPWSNLGYLRRAVGNNRTVPVEIGRSYTDPSWRPELMRFGEFVDQYVLGSDDESALGSPSGSASPAAREIGYMAQHNLLEQFPALANDIAIPDYCFVEAAADSEADSDLAEDSDSDSGIDSHVTINAWFGPRDTRSPLHTDPKNNIFVQVVGIKYLRLYSPNESPSLYAFGEASKMSNTSQVDIESPDLGAHPLFANAEYVECIVGPGDLLFIPHGWWHYVRSLTRSFSLSFWF
ncbi:jumonji domain-containing 5 [Polychytrium aggregatum]|uniref:jumonji domain-containing 5 n=1 Tax=Polychytrium aggregatum TaxID=110093 RepID=UPI0022FEE92A|nr:jumonji domain-containing 5 [Polychytrium aggregatum]KAI9199352.1 jumonji domain-containing 5 [Polychytrium aggregatum]